MSKFISGINLKSTGRPKYHPATLLKLYLYGYLNRIRSSRRLEVECQRNVELMWLLGKLAPDFKTIFSQPDIKATIDLGAEPIMPKTDTSSSEKKGIFNRSQFKYNATKTSMCAQQVTNYKTVCESLKGVNIWMFTSIVLLVMIA